jgi:hypothetical protein
LAGRVAHPLDDAQSFMKALYPPIPFDQPCLVALIYLSAPRRLFHCYTNPTIEATPQRSATRRNATGEVSVTTRIRHRLQAISTPQPETTDTDVSPAATHPPTPAAQPVHALQPALFTTPVPRGSTPKPSYRQRATQDERSAKPQLSLF